MLFEKIQDHCVNHLPWVSSARYRRSS
jgi:hypothetical protein